MNSRLKVWLGGFGKAIVTILFFSVVIGPTVVAITRCGTTELSEVGGKGEACYPNSTCEAGLTCFNVEERHVCLREVKPVINKQAKQCYTFSNKEKQEFTPCFETADECITSFSRVMQDSYNTILQACFYQK